MEHLKNKFAKSFWQGKKCKGGFNKDSGSMYSYVRHGQKRGNLLNGIAHTYVCTYTYLHTYSWSKEGNPFFSFRMYNFLFPAITYSRADEENWGCQSTNTFSSLKYWKQNLFSRPDNQAVTKTIFDFGIKRCIYQ